MRQRTRLYIDNPWEEVERFVYEIATDEITNAVDCLSPAETAWAERLGKRIARKVMRDLDGSAAECLEDGMRL